MNVLAGWKYRVARRILSFCMRVIHPITHVRGTEMLPQGAAMLCCNHTGITDPFWAIVVARLDRLPRTMAKKEIFKRPFFNWLYRKIGGFPVDREHTDVAAVKTAMQALRAEERVLIFPEGTRVKKGMKSEPHTGAMLIATRMKVPVVPIYVTAHRHLFCRVDVIYGEPYMPQYAGAKPTPDELQSLTDELFEKIRALGASVCG